MNVPLFKGLPSTQIEQLASIASYKAYRKGERVFSEGEEASGFYVVIFGRVKIAKLAPDGKEQILHIIQMQEPFGEVAVFAGERFPANAEAMEDSRILFLERDAFIRLIRKEPSVAMNMLALLSRRLRQFSSLIENLSLKDVPARLSSYLLYMSQYQGDSNLLELDVSKTLLANSLGTIPETLSRILAKMTQGGLIEVDGRRIRLLNRRVLEEVAAGRRTVM
ncbi:MAG TPA: Crp/Fnr family transcriptional regulator [Syntrophorhabdales bacterium]|nr:Crp/Fnr family transcriptional regulator [Syntrophorhabdales bacterium]